MVEKRNHKLFTIFRNFLLSVWNKEFLIFLFFFALSGIFWLTTALNETYEKELRIAVRIVNVPQNIVITGRSTDTVKVTVKDKGLALLPFVYGDRLQPMNFNFDTYANRNTGYGAIPASEILRQFASIYKIGNKVTGVKPDKIDFYFNFGQAKKVPVKLAGTVVPADKYYLSNYRFYPQYVTVYANKSVLDSLKFVSTEKLNITDFEDTITRVVALRRITGVKYVPPKVKLTLYPDILTENSVEVPIVPVNVPDKGGKILRLFPSRVKVHFVVGASQYRQINPEYFQVVADYQELMKHPSDKCKIYLRAYPHGVFQPRLDVQEVDYLLEQQDVANDNND